MGVYKGFTVEYVEIAISTAQASCESVQLLEEAAAICPFCSRLLRIFLAAMERDYDGFGFEQGLQLY